MQDPREREVDRRLHETALSSLDSLQDASLEPIDSAHAAYRKEPLFNKKVMLAWAIGAAVVWFAVSFVLPIAFESAKTAILQTIKEAEVSGSNVIIQRDGQKITITTKPAKSAQPANPSGPPAPSATAGTPAAAPADAANPQGPAKLPSHKR